MSGRHSPQRVAILEPMRGLAALAVTWFHFTNESLLLSSDSLLRSTGSSGWLGVQVFFVISGFVIPYSLYRGGYTLTRDFPRFVAKRILRLDPPYLVAAAISLALLYALSAAGLSSVSTVNISAPQLLAHLGYLNAFLGYEWLNPVFWTLAIEFQFYITIALLFPLIAHESGAIRLLGLGLLTIPSLLIRAPELVLVYGGLFAMGVVSFQRYVGLIGTAPFLVLALLSATTTALALNPLIALTGFAAALVIAFLKTRAGLPLTFLGTISYSLYLLHAPIGGRIVNFGARLNGGFVTQIVTLAAATAASLGAAWLMYRLVERPAQKWSSALIYKSNPRLAAATDEITESVP